MNEKDLIRQLKMLQAIRPREDWVVLTKNRVFSQEPETETKFGFVLFLPFFRHKLALAPVVSLFIIIGLFGFAQNTVPGDLLFSVKKMTETAQVGLSSAVEKPGVQLKLANKRLEELNRIAQANEVNNLGPAIEEFQANIAEATRSIVGMNANVTTSDSMVLKEIVDETKKLKENKQKVEDILATVIGDTDELNNAVALLERQLASQLIAGLESQTLSEGDEALLEEAKQYFEAGDYSQALYNIWLLSNNN